MIQRKGHHRDKRPSMVSEIAGRMRGSYGNILQNNYNSRTTTFGSNRAISLDHYSNHRRMSDGIQTVTSDSTVYYHQRLHDQDNIIRTAAGSRSKNSSCQGSTDVKLLVSSEDAVAATAVSTGNSSNVSSKIHTPTAATDISDTNRVQSSTIINNNNNNNHSSNNSSNTNNNSSKSAKSKLSSSVSCSNSPKSIITRLRQLTGRLSFSFDKDSRRMSSGTTQTIINKTSSSAKNNNMMPNICCNTKNSADGQQQQRVMSVDMTARNRAYSLDVPVTRYNYNSSAGSSYNGSHKSLSSNRGNDDGDDSTDNNSVFASKKMSAEVEPMDI